MSIAPITSVVTSSVSPTSYLPSAVQVARPDGNDGGFATSLASSVDGLQAMQQNSAALAVKAVTGDLADVHDYTIASTQSAVALELTATIRNKAIEAFSEIMRMQA